MPELAGSAAARHPPAAAATHFAAQLAYQTDVSDVHADLAAGVSDLVVVDARGIDAWRHGRLPGALHLPHQEIATRAALRFATLGYQVKEMIGGYEYWVREGFEVVGDAGPRRARVDELTAVAASCDC